MYYIADTCNTIVLSSQSSCKLSTSFKLPSLPILLYLKPVSKCSDILKIYMWNTGIIVVIFLKLLRTKKVDQRNYV